MKLFNIVCSFRRVFIFLGSYQSERHGRTGGRWIFERKQPLLKPRSSSDHSAEVVPSSTHVYHTCIWGHTQTENCDNKLLNRKQPLSESEPELPWISHPTIPPKSFLPLPMSTTLIWKGHTQTDNYDNKLCKKTASIRTLSPPNFSSLPSALYPAHTLRAQRRQRSFFFLRKRL